MPIRASSFNAKNGIPPSGRRGSVVCPPAGRRSSIAARRASVPDLSTDGRRISETDLSQINLPPDFPLKRRVSVTGAAFNAARYLSYPCPPPDVPDSVADPGPNLLGRRLKLKPQGSILVKTDDGVIEVSGNHGLSEQQLSAVLRLREASRSKKVRLDRITVGEDSGDSCAIIMFPEGRRRRTRLPTILKVGSREQIEEERDKTIAWKVTFREFSPTVIEAAFSDEAGALQFELIGGRCCMPRYVSCYHQVGSLAGLFEEAASQTQGGEGCRTLALSIMEQVFTMILPRATLQQACQIKVNLLELFDSESIITEEKAEAPVLADTNEEEDTNEEDLEFPSSRNGTKKDCLSALLKDCPPDLAKIVAEVIGRCQTPSDFFIDFHSKMRESLVLWDVVSLQGKVHGNLHFDNVLHDGESRAWVAGFTCAMRDGHVFSDIAHFLLAGVVIHSQIDDLADVFLLQELLLYIASVPDDLSKSFPSVPVEAAESVQFEWAFAKQMLQHFDMYSVSHGGAFRMDRPSHHILWVLLNGSLEVAKNLTSESHHQERMRLALFAAVAFAARLMAIAGKLPQPHWVKTHQNGWGQEGNRAVKCTGTPGLYLQQVGAAEAWVRDPGACESHSVLDDCVCVEVMAENRPEGGAETSVLAASITSEVELSVTAFSGSSKEDADQEQAASESTQQLQGFVSVCNLLHQWPRLLLLAPPGGGKTVTTRGVIAYTAQEQVQRGVADRLPLRVHLRKLAALLKAGEPDPLQAFAVEAFGDGAAAALSWEAASPQPIPWQARVGHQAIVLGHRVLLLGGRNFDGKPLQDVWATSDLGRRWEEMPMPPWPPRYDHQAVVTEEGRILVIGGMGLEGRRLRDVWESADEGSTWQELPCPRWSGRCGHRVIALSLSTTGAKAREHVVILGGNANGGHALQDAWVSENGGYTWQELDPPPWPARYGHQVFQFNSHIVVCGGTGSHGRLLSDVWSTGGNLWRTQASRVAKDAASGEHLTAVRWTQQPEVPWAARASHQVLPFRGGVVLFGGQQASKESARSAWMSSDGCTWHKLPQAAWSPVSAGDQQAVQTTKGTLVLGGFVADENGMCNTVAIRSRSLLLVVEGLDEESIEAKEEVLDYLERVLASESCHRWLIEARPENLDASTRSRLERLAFSQVNVKSFDEAAIRNLCSGRIGGLQQDATQQLERDLLVPYYRDIMENPLLATLVVQTVARNPTKGVPWRSLYQCVLEHCLQSIERTKQGDTDEFPELQRVGVEAAVCELAFEIQSRGTRCMSPTALKCLPATDAMGTLITRAKRGQMTLLFENHEDDLQFRFLSIQEFLAARHVWKCCDNGDGLPHWLVREGSSGAAAAIGCCRFFCMLADGRRLNAENFAKMHVDLGSILRNMSRAGDHEAVSRLLALVPNPQALLLAGAGEVMGHTALHLAAIHGHSVAARTLLKAASDSSALEATCDSEGLTPLHCAALHGQEEVVKVLLEFATKKQSLLLTPDQTDKQNTALHFAAKFGHQAVARTILGASQSPGALNAAVESSGHTPLHFAARGGHDSVARTLLEKAPNKLVLTMTASKFDKRIALHLAAEAGQEAVLRVLLEPFESRPAVLSATDCQGQTGLHLAAERGHAAAVQTMLRIAPEPGMLLVARERLTGQTPLHLAADAGHGSVVTALMEFALDPAEVVTAVDRCGQYTPLHLAAEKGRVAVARRLVEMAPDRGALLVMAEKLSGQLALHLAAAGGHAEVARALLEMAPDRGKLLTTAARGFTPLQLAAERGHEAVARVLLELAPDPNVLLEATVDNWCGFTSLHLAAYKGHAETASALLQLAPDSDRRAILEACDQKGRTPEELATDRGHKKVGLLLSLSRRPSRRSASKHAVT